MKIFGYDSPIVGALTRIGDVICLSVLWIVFSLPVFTMGAATAALYTTAFRYIRSGKGTLWKTFWNSFKGEFKRATIVWLVALIVMAFLTVDVFMLRSIRLSENPLGKLYWVVLALWWVALTWAVFMAAYIARINGGVRETLRFGHLLIILHPIRALGVLISLLAGAAVVLMVPFMALVAPAVVMLICSFPLERIFLAHQPTEEDPEASEESDETAEVMIDDQ